MELSSRSSRQGEIQFPMPINVTYGESIIGYGGQIISSSNGLSIPQNPENHAPYKKLQVYYKYKECLKNHAASMGGNAIDGCGEFMANGEEDTIEALTCSACHCHRNFHRKEIIQDDDDDISWYHKRTTLITSSPAPPPMANNKKKKRFRTKFSQEQKEKMLEFAEKSDWKMQKQEEDAVQRFCQEIGVKRRVLKVWMHNNKQNMANRSISNKSSKWQVVMLNGEPGPIRSEINNIQKSVV